MKIFRVIASFYVSITISVRGSEVSTPLISDNNNIEVENGGKQKVVSRPIASECKLSETCVRFCCRHRTDCLDPVYFELSKVREATKLDPSYKVIKGKPNCTDMYIEEKAPWEFINVCF